MKQLAQDLGELFGTRTKPKRKPANYTLRWPDGSTNKLIKRGKFWYFHAPDGSDHGFSGLTWAKTEARELGATITKD